MKRLIGGNWKMCCKLETLESFKNTKLNEEARIDVFIAIPYLYIDLFRGCFCSSNVVAGAQDVSKFENGPYTGEISAEMLSEYDVKYVIVGHSERRINLHETCSDVNNKLRNVLKYNLRPVLCLGESYESRQSGKYNEFIETQFLESTKSISNVEMDIAYEPIWAIGTGSTAEVVQIREIVSRIKDEMKKKSIKGRVIYGGSVNKENVDELSSIAELDGFLVGNASLDVEAFKEIIGCVTKKVQ